MDNSGQQITIKDIYYLIENTEYKGTYKYVSLIAIVLIIEESGSKDKLEISFADITRKMIELYWPFTDPSLLDIDESKLLKQSAFEKDLKMIKDLKEFRTQSFHTVSEDAEYSLDTNYYPDASKNLVKAIFEGPISRLQKNSKVVLYSIDDSKIVLEKDKVDFLLEHKDLIVTMCEQKWVELLIRYNHDIPEDDIHLKFQEARNSYLFIEPFERSDKEAADFEPLTEKGGVIKTRRQSNRVYRPNQVKFKKDMMHIYSNKCCVSGEDTRELLQGAHIEPYQNIKSDHLQNGLLLSAEIHLLYDNGLITIVKEDADTFKVFVNIKRTSARFHIYHNEPLHHIPDKVKFRPSAKSLRIQNSEFDKWISPEDEHYQEYQKSKKQQDAYISLTNT